MKHTNARYILLKRELTYVIRLKRSRDRHAFAWKNKSSISLVWNFPTGEIILNKYTMNPQNCFSLYFCSNIKTRASARTFHIWREKKNQLKMSVILTFILQSVRWCLERLYRVSRHEQGLSQEKKPLSENFTELGVIHLIKTLVTDAISLPPKRYISRLLRKPNTIFNTL